VRLKAFWGATCAVCLVFLTAASARADDTLDLLVKGQLILADKVYALERQVEELKEEVRNLRQTCGLKVPDKKKPVVARANRRRAFPLSSSVSDPDRTGRAMRPVSSSSATSMRERPAFEGKRWYFVATFVNWKPRLEKIKRELESFADKGLPLYYYISPKKGYLVVMGNLTAQQVAFLEQRGYKPRKVPKGFAFPELYNINEL